MSSWRQRLPARPLKSNRHRPVWPGWKGIRGAGGHSGAVHDQYGECGSAWTGAAEGLGRGQRITDPECSVQFQIGESVPRSQQPQDSNDWIEASAHRVRADLDRNRSVHRFSHGHKYLSIAYTFLNIVVKVVQFRLKLSENDHGWSGLKPLKTPKNPYIDLPKWILTPQRESVCKLSHRPKWLSLVYTFLNIVVKVIQSWLKLPSYSKSWIT